MTSLRPDVLRRMVATPLLPLILRQLRRRVDAMRHEPLADLAPQILRAELAVAHDVLQLAAEIRRDGLGPVGHGERADPEVAFCVRTSHGRIEHQRTGREVETLPAWAHYMWTALWITRLGR